MIAKTYLTVVSLLYFGLAMWCTFAPAETSQKIGFTLNGGSGKSEYMTVYGGRDIGPMTWKLAAGEWAILLLGLATMFYNGRSTV